MGMINRNVLYWLEAIKNGIDALVTASGEVKQSDWNEADTDAASYIKNKPTIKQADWNEATATDPGYIKNKPTIPQGALVVNGSHSDKFYVESQEVITAINNALEAGRPVILKDETYPATFMVLFSDGTPYYGFDNEGSWVVQQVQVAPQP